MNSCRPLCFGVSWNIWGTCSAEAHSWRWSRWIRGFHASLASHPSLKEHPRMKKIHWDLLRLHGKRGAFLVSELVQWGVRTCIEKVLCLSHCRSSRFVWQTWCFKVESRLQGVKLNIWTILPFNYVCLRHIYSTSYALYGLSSYGIHGIKPVATSS